jgi:pilus assembly protein Flp/PilA
MMNALKRFWKDEEGATMVEYGLLVALISVAAIGAIIVVRGGVIDAFDSAGNAVTDNTSNFGDGSTSGT